ncbi:MAG TPA: hypothetical protein PK059_02115 [Cyclobacteriaceae bacterium]|nr:hypothetical protein [Cyclobacteriaceae bacterium]
MAVNRVLTGDEKFTLQNDARFQNLCKQAVYDKAMYWTGLNGVNMADAATAARWAKSRLRSQAIVVNPSQVNGNVAQQFILFLKNIQLWDNAVVPFSASTVCDFMAANSIFDTLADNWMDTNIRGVDF